MNASCEHLGRLKPGFDLLLEAASRFNAVPALRTLQQFLHDGMEFKQHAERTALSGLVMKDCVACAELLLGLLDGEGATMDEPSTGEVISVPGARLAVLDEETLRRFGSGVLAGPVLKPSSPPAATKRPRRLMRCDVCRTLFLTRAVIPGCPSVGCRTTRVRLVALDRDGCAVGRGGPHSSATAR